MSEKEILEGNGIIEVFRNSLLEIKDGWVVMKSDGYKMNPVEALKYHKDWNELMSVVEKIESIGFISFINPRSCQIHANTKPHPKIICSKKGESKIEAVWLAVVDFVKWYNQNK